MEHGLETGAPKPGQSPVPMESERGSSFLF
jgi:hypothetical protein